MGESKEDVAAQLRNVLNSHHGYAFQQAVARFCADLQHRRSPWTLVQAECPVELNGKPTHIDFILEHSTTRELMIAECKRADPARARWGFARTLYNRRGELPGSTRPVLSVVKWASSPGRVEEQAHPFSEGAPYQIGCELSTRATGDGGPKDRLKLATDQVFRGVAGLIQAFERNGGRTMLEDFPVVIFPVVFTTADLFVTDTPLADAEITTGYLETITTAPASWLWYQQNLSRDLRPERIFLDTRNAEDSIEDTVQLRHTRAACIVNARSIDAFFAELAIGQVMNPL